MNDHLATPGSRRAGSAFFTSGADTILARGAAPSAAMPDHACQIVDYTFPAAGTYIMRVAIDAGLAASSASNSAFRFF